MNRGDISLDDFLDILAEISGQTPSSILAVMDEGAKLDYEVLEVIKKLRRKYKIGLLSYAPSSFLRELLKELSDLNISIL